MVLKTLVADDGVRAQLEYLWVRSPVDFQCGLVVGHRVVQGGQVQRDIVLHLAPTPAGDENEDQSEEEREAKGAAVPKAIEELEPEWVLEHYKQVAKMLPGGVSIVGLFLVTSKDVFASTIGMTHVRKILKTIFGQENLEQPEMSILHLDSKKRGIVAKAMDPSPAAAQSLHNIDFKFEPNPGGFQKVEGSFILDNPVVFTTKQSAMLLQDKVDVALKQLGESIDSSIVLFDNAFRQPDELLDLSQQEQLSKKGKKGHKASKNVSYLDDDDDDDEMKSTPVSFLLTEEPYSNLEDAEFADITSRLKLSGKIHVCAFLHSKATVKEATLALKQDILRSLRGRLEMHCDSLISNEATDSGHEEQALVVHEPPRRILIKLPHSPVCISDYLFPGETPEDSNDSVEELFGYKPPIEDVNDELELVAAPRETLAADTDDETGSQCAGPAGAIAEVLEEPTSPSSKSKLLIFLAILGLAALVTGYLFITQPPEDESDPEPAQQRSEL